MNAYWTKYLPGFVRLRLDGRHGLQAVLGNGGWLIADKLLRLGVGLVVGIWIVRYLGPTQLGLLSYAWAFAGLFAAFAGLGLDRIVVQELVRHPERENELMGSAFALKLIAGIAGLALTIFAIVIVRNGETQMYWLVGISAAGFVFQSLNVVDYFFQSKVQAKYAVLAASGAFAIVTLAKIIMLLTSAPLIAFAWAGLAEVVLTASFLVVSYRLNRYNIWQWQYSRIVARGLLVSSWPLMLSGLAIMIYMRIDQIMIGEILGDKEVGLFSAAVRISEIWYFIPTAIVSSVVPIIIQSKKKSERLYYARLQTLLTTLVWLGICVAAVITLVRGPAISFLFGAIYAESADVLAIHIWGGVFVALGVGSGIWFTVENLQKYSFYRALIGGLVNVVLNITLIPKYGINGAAMATVVSYALSVFSIGLLKDGRVIFRMMLRAFVPLSFNREMY